MGNFFLCCLSSYSGHDSYEDRAEGEFWGLTPHLSVTLKQERDWEGQIPQNRHRAQQRGENLESLQQAKARCVVTTVSCQPHLGTGEGLGSSCWAGTGPTLGCGCSPSPLWCCEPLPSQQGDSPGGDWGCGQVAAFFFPSQHPEE